jgi:hypothetical protein
LFSENELSSVDSSFPVQALRHRRATVTKSSLHYLEKLSALLFALSVPCSAERVKKILLSVRIKVSGEKKDDFLETGSNSVNSVNLF